MSGPNCAPYRVMAPVVPAARQSRLTGFRSNHWTDSTESASPRIPLDTVTDGAHHEIAMDLPTTPSSSGPPRTTCGCTSPGTTTTRTCPSSSGARCLHLRRPGQALPRRPGRPLREPARPRPHRPRRGRGQAGRAAGLHAAVVLRHPTAIELAERVAGYAPGDLNRVFFTSGGGEAVETAWKLAKNYFKLTGKPMKHKVISRAIAYHGTTQGALSITGLPGAQAAVRAAGAVDVPGPEHQLLPGPEHAPTTSRRSAAGPPTRSPSRSRTRARHRRRGLPRAGAERRRLLPAAARLLPAGPRDLRRVRRPAGLRRGHLRVRPARPHVRRRALRLRARHDHLRQGHHLRLRPARRDDRHRPADGAVPEGTATSFAHGYTFGGHPVSTAVALANLDVFENENIIENVRANEGAFRATLERLNDLPIVGDVRGDGYFYGIELVKDKATKETFNDEECERLLYGFLSKAALRRRALLPGRRPRRPGRPARAAADLRPGALRRDGADPPRRARQGRHAHLTRAASRGGLTG